MPRRPYLWRCLIAGGGVLLLLAWVRPAPGQATSPQAVARPPLRVGTSGDYAPFSIVDADGARSGFDIELAARLGRDLGRPVAFVSFRWPQLRAALEDDRFDLAASGVTIRAERLLAGRFTRPYARSGAVAVTRAVDRERFPAPEALDDPEVRIAVNRGGHLERVARATFLRARIETVDDNQSLAERVVRHQADALVTDTAEMRHLLARYPSLRALPPLTRDRKALLVGRRHPGLHAEVDGWLAAREADGWLDELRRRWLGPEAALAPPDAKIETVVALVEQRLGLMPWVAAAKRRAGRPLEDRRQEGIVLEAARASAARAGLDPGRIAALFESLIDAAKEVQRGAPPVDAGPSLSALRAAVQELGARLVAELAASRTVRGDPRWADALGRSVRDMAVPGLGLPARERLAGVLADATAPAATR